MITDEMVDAALREFKCWAGDGYSPSKQQIRAALEAAALTALTALRSAGMAVVPREATTEQIVVGQEVFLDNGYTHGELNDTTLWEAYRWMINTAEGKTE